ncbi:MAG: putative signal-transduction protein with domain [Caulobacteraceae bacterium]|jgi:signal-transduction protein with cAMP-binding, CBS, and nucleotidyltransferase domain|nr:putative signal-transduction protein with domain [Caulobacteraceae bacterium]
MLVSQILKQKGGNVFTCSPQETLLAAASVLHSRKVGALVVLDEEDHVIGIVSERDIVRTIAQQGMEGLSLSVASCMTRGVVYAELTEGVDALMARMTDRRVRHLPVCEDGRLKGIVSIGDVVKTKLAETEAEAQELKAYIAHA